MSLYFPLSSLKAELQLDDSPLAIGYKMSNTDTTYYIRVRGKILGPYNVAQLKILRGRGQFRRANEVSTDRQTWQSAAIIEHLFGGVIKQAKQAPDDALAAVPGGSPPSRKVNPIWHYSVGSDQYGPVTLLELRGLVNSGQLTADDLVWKEGLPDWTPVSDIGELNAAQRESPSVRRTVVTYSPSDTPARRPHASRLRATTICRHWSTCSAPR